MDICRKFRIFDGKPIATPVEIGIKGTKDTSKKITDVPSKYSRSAYVSNSKYHIGFYIYNKFFQSLHIECIKMKC